MGRDFRHRSSSDFVCRHCKRPVGAESYGTRQRNHCPYCLWSLHLDESPGDRRSACQSLMEPIGIWVKRDGEWAIIHRCFVCGTLRTNRVAGDDDPWAMMALAAKALAQPPFPLAT
ncbi:MAG: RNHCP domain-containing protein [Vicinamibacterales bacterium]|nr:RNHCP domain-containing protein [Vicinamibacterales bacterium]